MRQGEKCNLNAFYTCLHTATHIDAPLHFINGGSSIDKFPLSTFIGECVVVEAPPGPITGAFAEENFPWKTAERVLIKGNGNGVVRMVFYKRLGAVNGVDHPAEFRIFPGMSGLFPENIVIGEFFGDFADNDLFHSFIGDGNQIFIGGFAFDIGSFEFAEVTQ